MGTGGGQAQVSQHMTCFRRRVWIIYEYLCQVGNAYRSVRRNSRLATISVALHLLSVIVSDSIHHYDLYDDSKCSRAFFHSGGSTPLSLTWSQILNPLSTTAPIKRTTPRCLLLLTSRSKFLPRNEQRRLKSNTTQRTKRCHPRTLRRRSCSYL